MHRHVPEVPEAEGRGGGPQWGSGPPKTQAAQGRAGPGPAVHLLAAVGVEDAIEEFHAHDGEGVVEGEQGEAQAEEEEGQRDRVT